MYILETIKKFIKVNIKDAIYYPLVALGGGVFGIALALIIGVAIAHEEGYATVGTMMALIFSAIWLLFGMALGGMSDFQTMVSMNRNRLSYLIAKYILTAAEIAVTLFVIFLIFKFELFLGSVISPGCEVEEFYGLSFGTQVAFVFAFPVVGMFLSIMYGIFDKKFFWVMWGVYMLCALGIPRISSAMNHNPESNAAKIGFFFQRVIDTSSVQFIVACVVGVVGLAVANYFLYRKAEIKF